jgi:anthraniloyl-CoA monooxygenase
VRRRFADVFSPTLTREGSKFIWLGTTQRFDAFTFIFEETEAGTFQAHIYPFSEDVSTFIVECTEQTWRKAGLDAVDPATLAPGESDHASIARLEQLFADHLDGHRLLGNNSRWLDWTTIRNRRWRHGNVVLLGDAAHTAHFSIGSGTKLAMEDAISLAGAVARSDDLDRAIDTYEAERRPMVDRVQEAARESLAWFDRYPRYLGAAAGMGGAGAGFDAPTFAYSLLTRDLTVICHTIGFDPYIGFYHQPRFGRPALAQHLGEGLDLHRVAGGGACPVRLDVVDLPRLHARGLECAEDHLLL